jgi:hypothetical protein
MVDHVPAGDVAVTLSVELGGRTCPDGGDVEALLTDRTRK